MRVRPHHTGRGYKRTSHIAERIANSYADLTSFVVGYRFDSTPEQADVLRRTFGCVRVVYRDENAARVMPARGAEAIAATGEAEPPGTLTWADTPCVVPEPSSLLSSAGDETSGGVINPK
ncbi:hypothetical protein QO001_005615 [Methylobacterium brachiatum]|uniref:Transposase putative helix-turn-helix domain-containing protein n=1 Tax=Methylobacterium brachiatum TaxID=269660 RepID=A0AAJ1U2A0_9HYPH|nr:hypothetical protein [Methylobacterium brachiatum]